MVLFPAIEVVSRLFGTTGIVASPVLVQHLTLYIGFSGAIIASRRNKLLSLSNSLLFNYDNQIVWPKIIAKVTTIVVVTVLALGAWNLVMIEKEFPTDIAPFIPRWVALLIMPIGFASIAFHMIYNSYSKLKNRVILVALIILIILLFQWEVLRDINLLPYILIAAILFSLFKGAPIFIGLGGLALLFFWRDWTPISAISAETYRIVVSPTLPTIPLFTLAGYMLAESKASERLVLLFRALFGWIPGGTPVVLVLLCGFFTALTGGSGVTILALGGLLMPVLIKEGYSKKFSLGLITVAGSLGLLFPPSLPLIIYGVTAGISIKSVFLAGIVPGLIRVGMIGSWAVWQGKVQSVSKHNFNLTKIISALKNAKWEAMIPFFVLFGIFGGYTTLVETASLISVYIFIIEFVIYKDLKFNDLRKIILDCSTLIGGVLIILGVAMGLTSYLVDAQIPLHLLEWVKSTISSKFVFLLMLNIFLLAVGCLMDIFSAIIIVVPLITPLGAYFGIDPIHLAIIFIANLELGFLTPPVGMNLFLSSYRFEEPMSNIYKSTLPFFVVMLLSVIAITYIPILSTWPLK
ncbi:MAG: TRAP transporter large permease subunit [Candidatus Neomarinimicrobiota bacterium]|nr:TRAP transporter large permease subunit [Candidatus Neomarinimicrobiota bacterium]